MGRIELKCRKAADMYLVECKSGFPKYKFLPDWLESKAYYLNRGRVNPTRNYKKLERGALVKINFGVNVGSELSGHHFAIVLSKNDSVKNSVLTVVPVTSHPNRYTIELDSLISIKMMEKVLDLSTKKVIEITAWALKLGKVEKENYLSFIEEKSTSLTKLITSGQISLADLEKKVASLQGTFPYNKEMIIKFLDLTAEVNKAYARYNKISYAKCNDITTISKDRIMLINKLDPSGKIKVSKETLDKIDAQIIKNYTGISS